MELVSFGSVANFGFPKWRAFPLLCRGGVRGMAAEVRGVGVDTLSIDHGLSRDFAVHHIVNAAGKYGLENVAHLDKLPPRGFYVIVAPIRIESGSGGPARVIAVLRK